MNNRDMSMASSSLRPLRYRHATEFKALAAVAVGAVAIIISGLIHLYLWDKTDGYRSVPTVGPLFLIQGISGCVLGVAMVATRRVALSAVGGLYNALSLGGLYLSMHGGLFGYDETLDAPYVKTTIVVEAIGLAACVVAGVTFAASRSRST
jgi:hypothetical protein